MSPRDRPFSRSLIKTASRILLGRSRGHFQERFPGLKLDRVLSGGHIIFKNAVVGRLYDADRLGQGQQAIYIVGSGPSINDCDMARVEPGTALLLNGAINLMGREIPRPLAIAIEDERFVWRHFSMIRDRVGAGTICLLSVAVIRAICEHDPAWISDKEVVLIDNIARPYGARHRKMGDLAVLDFVRVDRDGRYGLSLDPDKGVFQGGSVAVSAMQFAMACRPKRIGLFGIDISNANAPRFYEKEGAAAFSGVAGAQTRIVGHFDLARTLCLQQGISLECYSKASALLTSGYTYSDRFAMAHGRSCVSRLPPEL
jgi:hypothetical protein